MRGALEDATDRGDEPGVLVRDHEPHIGQSPRTEVAEKGPPEGLVF
jgi:hypothetical protein